MKDDRPIEQLVEDLWDKNEKVRKQAMKALAEIGAPAVPALLRALKSELKNFENPSLRQAIIQMGDPAFKALLAALQPKNHLVGVAAKTLALWGDPRAVEPLIEAMLNPQMGRQGKLHVIDALGAFRDPRAFKALITALSDPYPSVRIHAARALAEYGDPSAMPLITDALSDQSDKHYREELPRVLTHLKKRQRERAGARTQRERAPTKDKAAYFGPDVATAYYNRGLLRARLQDYARAIQDYGRAIKLNPEQAEIYYSRGLAYARLRNYARAIEDYERAIKLNPEESKVYHSRGLARAELQDYARAIEDYARAIELNPKSAMVYHNRGLAYARLGRSYELGGEPEKGPLDRVSAALRHVFRSQDLHAPTRLQAYTRAIEDLKRAIELNPKFPQTHYYNMARVYALMGDVKEAYEWLEKVIELDRGYGRMAWSDEDFKELRENERFKTLIGMNEYYEIIPGASIGPFKLGMTRHEIGRVRKLERDRGIRFPLEDVGKKSSKAGSPSPGVYVYYDASGNCCKIEAIFGYVPSPPIFTLAGHIVNGMTDKEAASILRSMATSVRFSYASVSSPAGLRTIKWEASDEHIMAIVVLPGKRGS